MSYPFSSYDAAWYNSPLKVQSLVGIILCNCNKVGYVDAYGIYTSSLSAHVKVCNDQFKF